MQTALFIIAKIWKQPRCPTVGGKIKYGHPDKGILFNTETNDLSQKTWRKLQCVK